jgi:hypothetical protein
MRKARPIVVTPKRHVTQCLKTWRTTWRVKHAGSHVCIRDEDHENVCLCSCGSKRRDA